MVLSSEEVYRRTVRACVMVLTNDGRGSGFVAHVGRRLVVTNDHVLAGDTSPEILFPLYVEGRLVTDP